MAVTVKTNNKYTFRAEPLADKNMNKQLSDYETLGRLRGILDLLSWRVSINNPLVTAQAALDAVESYHQLLMNEANQGVDPEIPTEAEIDEMARVHEATRKAGRAPHEL